MSDVVEHTENRSEELSGEELEQAMSDLNISADEMTDEEYAQVEQADETRLY